MLNLVTVSRTFIQSMGMSFLVGFAAAPAQHIDAKAKRATRTMSYAERHAARARLPQG